ncbi:hypothetical protein [Leptospira saintgironsiae]|uniref:DUF8156 domain-containing protein n=1 Tax=Leptospira saintgironsiae TaxID=2023183 RepID=A0A2M9Y7I7_9LEPT|nr:hypothetical protein [Leptospira saintgironsiae]PJZ47550.1 hypothetical protein CH362_18590 [Leptospira saintgironsiae]
MGRTVTAYSQEIKHLADDRFKDFRRALPRKYQEAFDDVMRIAKNQLPAGVMAANPYSIETVLLMAVVVLSSEVNDLKKNKSA